MEMEIEPGVTELVSPGIDVIKLATDIERALFDNSLSTDKDQHRAIRVIEKTLQETLKDEQMTRRQKRREERRERARRSAVAAELQRIADITDDAEYRQNIEQTLDDENRFSMFYDGLLADQMPEPLAFGDGTFLNWLTMMMEWFIENQDLIREFIDLISSLFSGGITVAEFKKQVAALVARTETAAGG